MKLEYITNTRTDITNDKMIRLKDYDESDLEKLISLIKVQLIRNGFTIDLGNLDFTERVNCNLVLETSEDNAEIRSINDQIFICSLTRESYTDIVEKLESLLADNNGYQFLIDPENDGAIELLVSKGGGW